MSTVELWIIEFLAVSVLWVLECSFLGCFVWALHGHDKRMAFMGHSLRAHAVLMLTHAFGALDRWRSRRAHRHSDSCAQLARRSTGRRRHSRADLQCRTRSSQPRPRSRCCLLRVALRSVFFQTWGWVLCRGLLHRRVSSLGCPASSGPVKRITVGFSSGPVPALAECCVWSALHLSGFAESRLMQRRDRAAGEGTSVEVPSGIFDVALRKDYFLEL